MITRYAASGDGLHWRDQGVVLRGTPGSWDARGARITAILRMDPLTVLYDGRATAEAGSVGSWAGATMSALSPASNSPR